MTAKQPYVERDCRVCGERIPESARSDAVFCGAACRTKGTRIRDRAAYLAAKTDWHKRRGRWLTTWKEEGYDL